MRGEILHQIYLDDTNIHPLTIDWDSIQEQCVKYISIVNTSASGRAGCSIFCAKDGSTFDNTTMVSPSTEIMAKQRYEICASMPLRNPNQWAVQASLADILTVTFWGWNR